MKILIILLKHTTQILDLLDTQKKHIKMEGHIYKRKKSNKSNTKLNL